MLLVFDDVWQAEDLAFLRVFGEHLYTLITTRNADQVVDAEQVDLEVMTRTESLQLLTRASHGKVAETIQDSIADRLGDLPLALAIVGAMLADGQIWSDIQEQLDLGRLPLVRDVRQRTIFAVVSTSVQSLDPNIQQRVFQLAIFPANQPLEEVAVQRLWYSEETLSIENQSLARLETRDLLARLRRRTLIQEDNSLHDLVYDYLQAATTDEQRKQWHHGLITTYGPMSSWGMLPDEPRLYGWRRLAWHLWQTGDREAWWNLETNVSYLQGKIARFKVSGLLADFAMDSSEGEIETLHQTLQLSAHVLDQLPEELLNQFMGRGGPVTLLHDVPERISPHFMLVSSTLQQAGGAQVRILAGHTGRVEACALTGDRRYALSGSQDGTLRLWDLQSGLTLLILVGHNGPVDACAISGDGRYALSGSHDKMLRLWDLRTGETLHTLARHTGWVRACALTEDGHYALSGSQDGTLRLWSLQTGLTLLTLVGHTGPVYACALTRDGRYGLSGSLDGTLRLWNLKTGETRIILEGHSKSVWACALTDNEDYALSGSLDGTLRLWNLKNWGDAAHPWRAIPTQYGLVLSRGMIAMRSLVPMMVRCGYGICTLESRLQCLKGIPDQCGTVP